jgi:hypothetical protein
MTDTDPSHVRVHYGLSGSVPLQLFEFVFEPGGCYVLDCGAFTPLFGLARGKHTERAAALDAVYDTHGVDGLVGVADSVTWVSVAGIERVRLYTGGWLGRPKLALQTTGELSVRPVRLHGVDVERVSDALEALLAGCVPVERVDGIGLRD